MSRDKYIAISDGFCENNGSYYAKSGGSYAVFKVPNDELHPALETLKDPILFNHRFSFNKIDGEKVTTNNVAEGLTLYCLLLDLQTKHILDPKNFVTIYMDSKLIAQQVKKMCKINNPQLKNIHKKIDTLFKDYRDKYKEEVWKSLQIKLVSGIVMKQTIIDH